MSSARQHSRNPFAFSDQIAMISFNITQDKVHVHDLQATILNQLGFDHTKLTFRHTGRDYRLTDLDGEVVKKILA